MVKRLRLTAAMWIVVSILFTTAAVGQGGAVVEGKLVNGTDRSLVAAGLKLDVISLEGGMNVLRSLNTDGSGNFRIDGLSRSSNLMIRVDYQGVNYHGPVNFDASGRAGVEITIYESTDSMEDIRLESVQLAFQMNGEQLNTLESYSFNNQTDPPKTYISEEGGISFSKTGGISGLPSMSVRAPGSAFPLTQPISESPDGESIFSLYPLRPGITVFNLEQSLPYAERRFIYRKRILHDVGAVNVGLIPKDMEISGEGLVRVETDQQDFAVYAGGPVKAGTEFIWTFTGGTQTASSPQGESRIVSFPPAVGRNALVAGPLILMCFILVLWFASTRVVGTSVPPKDTRVTELKERRDFLLSHLATLDNQYENQVLDRKEYLRRRESGKRQLRRIFMLLSGR